MNRRTLFLLCSAFALPASKTQAQKIPVPGGDRIVQLHDVGDLIRASVAVLSPGADQVSSPAKVEAYERNQLESMADFARTFMRPPLDGEQDVQPLGRSYLVALLRPQQQAWLENLVRRQQQAGSHQMLLEVRRLRVSDHQYGNVFQPVLDRLGATPETIEAPTAPDAPVPVQDFFSIDSGQTRTLAVVSKEDAETLMAEVDRAQIDQMMAPRVVTLPMNHVDMQVGETIRYVRDFEIEQGSGAPAAVPVPGELFDGTKISASCGLVGEDLVGLSLHVEVDEVERPIAEFTTELSTGQSVTIELPNVRTLRLDQRVLLPDGGTGLFAVQHQSGTHTVFLATVTVQ